MLFMKIMAPGKMKLSFARFEIDYFGMLEGTDEMGEEANHFFVTWTKFEKGKFYSQC